MESNKRLEAACVVILSVLTRKMVAALVLLLCLISGVLSGSLLIIVVLKIADAFGKSDGDVISTLDNEKATLL